MAPLARVVNLGVVGAGTVPGGLAGRSRLPGDPARLDGQPKVKDMFDAFAGGFEARAKAGQLGDPREVVDALVELVESPRGKRPLRRTVGKDVEPGVGPINETCAKVQGQLLGAFGLR